jgi:hypothetical protein
MAQPMSDATNEPLGKVNETRLSRTTVRVPREKRQELAQRLEARAMRMSGLEPPQGCKGGGVKSAEWRKWTNLGVCESASQVRSYMHACGQFALLGRRSCPPAGTRTLTRRRNPLGAQLPPRTAQRQRHAEDSREDRVLRSPDATDASRREPRAFRRRRLPTTARTVRRCSARALPASAHRRLGRAGPRHRARRPGRRCRDGRHRS